MNRAIKGLVAFVLLAVAGGAFAQVPDYDGAGTFDYTSAGKTTAGDTVHNIVGVTYDVEGVTQTVEWNTDDNTETGNPLTGSFVVDRVVLVNVYAADTPKTVAQRQVDAYLTYEVRNDSNATIDMQLTTHELGDVFAGATFTLYLDADDSGAYEDGVDTVITGGLLEDMVQGDMRRVFVVGDIPTGLVHEDEHVVTLLATAHEVDGAAIVETTTADTAGMDTVFGDLDGTYDVGPTDAEKDLAGDGRHSADGAFKVAATTINVSKSSAVVEDPFNGTDNPKAIPGATVLYCIAVENAGASNATNVRIADGIPANTTYVDDSIRVVSGPVTCNEAAHAAATLEITDAAADDVTESTTNGGISGNSQGPGDTGPTVNTQVNSLGAGNTTTTLFKVEIQ